MVENLRLIDVLTSFETGNFQLKMIVDDYLWGPNINDSFALITGCEPNN